ncbi:hypothetical protein [Paenibacillus humicola]|uniref:MmyB family transcriptional regulator n=1 Tax=Paenibacillus humicola TaxID=3110540 RepID=UPI003B835353
MRVGYDDDFHTGQPPCQSIVSPLYQLSARQSSPILYRHPKAGLLTLQYNSFPVAEAPDLILTVFTPDPLTDTKDKLAALMK